MMTKSAINLIFALCAAMTQRVIAQDPMAPSNTTTVSDTALVGGWVLYEEQWWNTLPLARLYLSRSDSTLRGQLRLGDQCGFVEDFDVIVHADSLLLEGTSAASTRQKDECQQRRFAVDSFEGIISADRKTIKGVVTDGVHRPWRWEFRK